MRRLTLLLVSAVMATALLSAPAPAGASGLFGVVTQGQPAPRDYERMGDGGVGTLRFGLWWHLIEQQPGVYDWSYADAIMAGAASAGVRPLPFVYGTPAWLADRPAEPPLAGAPARRAWQNFLRAAVGRYGRGGEFWRGRSDRSPVAEWQIWNEPNFAIYWRPKPDAIAYAELLELADNAIESVDGGARVMLAGVAPVRGGVEPWEFLEELYTVPGVARHFETLALHPYSPNLYGIKFQLRLMRRVASASADPLAPLAITELGWASAGARTHALVRTPEGQASMLRRAFAYLRRTRSRWRLRTVSWFSWRDTAQSVEAVCDFCKHSGLFTLRGKPKPAWTAFRHFSAE